MAEEKDKSTPKSPEGDLNIKVPQYNYGLVNQAADEYEQRNGAKPGETYLSRFSSIYPAPKPVTPQQEQKQRNVASVAESLKSLAEIYGQAKGAYLRPRTADESTKAEQQILYNKNKYDADLREYQRAYIAAGGQDSEELRRLREKALGYGKMIADNDYNAQKMAFEKEQKEQDKAEDRAFRKEMQKDSQQFRSGENQKSRESAEAKKKSASNIVNIQDRGGDIYEVPYRDWNVKAQDLYEKMKSKGLKPLMTTKKDPSDITGMKAMDVEDKNANNIRAYVERNLQNPKYMTQEMWNEVYSLSTKTPYKNTTINNKQQPVKVNW